MTDSIEVAVLIVCHNGRDHLHDCLQSVLSSDDGSITRHIVVVDNASTDGSAAIVERDFPGINLVRCESNRGFAGGNNAGWEFISWNYPLVEYIALLNQDTLVQSGWLRSLVEHMDNRPVIGAAQAKILLYPDTLRINTAGNQSHYLGFGFTTAYGEVDDGRFDAPAAIDFPSGAAMLIRAAAIRRAALFDDLFFLYLEDADLGWKLRQLGYRIEAVGTAVVWHKYIFQEDYRSYYYLERNRWYLLGTYYKWATLLILLPAIVAMETGQIYFAWRHGVLKEKFRAFGFFLSKKNLARLSQQRAAAQGRRLISDRAFTAGFISEIHFPKLKSKLLERVGNPILKAYWSVARRVIFW